MGRGRSYTSSNSSLSNKKDLRGSARIAVSATHPIHPMSIYHYSRIVKAKLFIDEHYAEKIDLENISGEACFSRFHFIRLFKRIYKKTPHQYLVSVRVKKAAQFLMQGFSIAETCEKVGFDSESTFKGLFRRVQGQTPGEFRSFHLRRQERLRKSPLSFIPNCFASSKGWV